MPGRRPDAYVVLKLCIGRREVSGEGIRSVKPCLELVCGYQFTDHLPFKAGCWIMKKIRVFWDIGSITETVHKIICCFQQAMILLCVLIDFNYLCFI